MGQDTTFVDGTTLTVASWFQDVNDQVYINAGVCYLTSVAGTNTITGTTSPAQTAYKARQVFWFIPANTNTGATTLNVLSPGAKNVFAYGAACIGGEIVQNVPCGVLYDGTQFNLINPQRPTSSISTTFTFNGTPGAPGTSSAVTVTWQKVGRFIQLNIPAALATTGTSSNTFTSDTVLPASIRPAANQESVLAPIQNNGAVVAQPGSARVNTSGNIVVFRDLTGAAFTNSSVCGIPANFSLLYYA